MKTLNVDAGFADLISGLVSQRNEFLGQLEPGKSVIGITFTNSKKLTCVYKTHDDKSITVGSTKETIDHLLHSKDLNISGPFTCQDFTFPLTHVSVVG